MAAQPVEKLPEGDDWLYELKLDGYRALLLKDGARVQIRFVEWTAEGRLRHAIYVGLRDDKLAKDARREV
jgi:ATP-dependent DNA ligase